ncbi:phosphohydrolase [Niastella koreensis]|uniref:Metal dependent phosphohydrolase n=2 Tax=Niastella koreensis TaxID=354356 RepID=G8T729_NIAKG|nr:phosphonate degradation HD-domain oxygenase [Niastella koreensis]AEV99050.1 metal dependent phosphohydrolase [Niastella koreensis GR20-10]OQP43965.1 phosphohydrolase [Niastella koreensis]
MNSTLATNIANEIIQLYKQYGGSEYAGEKVTQLEHMVQAARLAEQQGYEEEVILAAFLHDIGHICEAAHEHNAMDGWGIKDHEEVGAVFLKEKGFSKRLSRLVESHVEAKRYLTWKDPLYYEQLSEASKKTLEYQGGPMLTDEAVAFEQDPLFHLIIQMRHWDDVAKIEGMEVSGLDRYREMIVRHLLES